MKQLALVVLLLSSAQSPAAQGKIDSLTAVLNIQQDDTPKVNTLNELSVQFSLRSDYGKEMEFSEKALQLARALGYNKGTANALHNIGGAYTDQGNYAEALKNYFASLAIRQEINDKKGLAGSYGNIGLVYYRLGNYPEALKNYFTSLKIKEEIKDRRGIAGAYNNIGLIYREQGNYPEALNYYLMSLQISEALGNKQVMGATYNNIGIICKLQRKYTDALKYSFMALKAREAAGDKNGTAGSYNNIGTIYQLQAGEPGTRRIARDSLLHLAMNYYKLSLKIKQDIGDKDGIASCYINLGDVNTRLRDLALAKKYLTDALSLSLETRNKERIKESYYSLSVIDSSEGDRRKGYEDYKRYILYRDSLVNEENTRKSVRTEMQFEFNKIRAADSVKVVEEKRISAAELRSEKSKQYSLYAGLGLVLVFSGFVYNRFRITRAQKRTIEEQKMIVEEQKLIVEEKNRDILDSIHYARRIQRALLPSEPSISRNLNKLQK